VDGVPGKPMRALVVGFGSIGKRHASNIRNLCPDAEIVLVRRGGQPAYEADHIKAVIVENLEAGVALKPDFAVLAIPASLHFQAIEVIFRAGVPCYIEKPVVATRSEFDSLRRLLCELSPPITYGGCNLRFLPSLQAGRQVIISGRIGTPIRANLQAGQWLPDWRPTHDYRLGYSANSDLGGGVILDLIHEIDSARWWLGDFEHVLSMGGKHSSLEINSEDVACILLANAARPPIVSIGMDYVARRRIRRYEVVGETGTLVWDLAEKTLEIVRRDTVEPVECITDGYDVANTYVAAMTHFLDCVVNRREMEHDVHDAMKSMDLALRAKEAVRL
jgi:predicted dehydrogenase